MSFLYTKSLGISRHDSTSKEVVVLRNKQMSRKQLRESIRQKLKENQVGDKYLTVLLNNFSLFITIITKEKSEFIYTINQLFSGAQFKVEKTGNSYYSITAQVASIYETDFYNRRAYNIQKRCNVESHVVGNEIHILGAEKETLLNELKNTGNLKFRFVNQNSSLKIKMFYSYHLFPVSLPVAEHNSKSQIIDSVQVNDKVIIISLKPSFLEQLLILWKKHMKNILVMEVDGVIYGSLELQSDKIQKQIALSRINDQQNAIKLKRRIEFPIDGVEFATTYTQPRNSQLIIIFLIVLLALVALYVLIVRRRFILTFVTLAILVLKYFSVSSIFFLVCIIHMTVCAFSNINLPGFKYSNITPLAYLMSSCFAFLASSLFSLPVLNNLSGYLLADAGILFSGVCLFWILNKTANRNFNINY